MSDAREHAIRERAYAIWEQEGRPSNRSLPNWLMAEAEIGTEQIVGISALWIMASRLNPRRLPRERNGEVREIYTTEALYRCKSTATVRNCCEPWGND